MALDVCAVLCKKQVVAFCGLTMPFCVIALVENTHQGLFLRRETFARACSALARKAGGMVGCGAASGVVSRMA